MRIFTTIILSFFFLLCAPISKAQEIFVLTPNAWKEYSQGVDYNHTEEWLATKGYEYFIYSGSWTPKQGENYWLYYRYLGLRVWFLVDQGNQMKALREFKSHILTVPEVMALQQDLIFIQPVHFPSGKTLHPVDVMYEIGITSEPKNQTKVWKPDQQEEFKPLAEKLLSSLTSGIKSKDPESEANYYQGEIDKWSNIYFNEVPIPTDLQRKFNQLKNQFGDPGNGFTKNDGFHKNDKRGKKGDGHSDGTNTDGTNTDGTNTDGTNTDGTNTGRTGSRGSEGIWDLGLPIKANFSKWFQLLFRELVRYLQIEELTKKALLVAYMIAPELIENCAEFFSKVQQLMSIRELDKFLDVAAEIYMNLDKYLGYLRQAHDLLTSQALQDIVDQLDWENIDLDDIVNAAEKIKLDDILNAADKFGLPPEAIKAFEFLDQTIGAGEFTLGSLSNMTKEQLRQGFTNAMKTVVVDQFNQRIGSKYGLDFNGFWDCVEQKKCEDWLKRQGTSLATRYLPRTVSVAVPHLLNGNYEQAAKQSIIHGLGKVPHLNKVDIEGLYDNLKSGNYEEAVRGLADSYFPGFSEYEQLVRDVLAGKPVDRIVAKKAISSFLKKAGANEVAEYFSEYGLEFYELVTQHNLKIDISLALQKMDLSQLEIEQVIEEGAKAWTRVLLDQMAKTNGFSDPAAREALLAGQVTNAIELQMNAGYAGSIDYKSLVSQLIQHSTNRLLLLRALHQLSKDEIPLTRDELEYKLINYRLR
ncbi:MAG: hypothetical protein AAF502_17200 [Bacteroidota bacterium]